MVAEMLAQESRTAGHAEPWKGTVLVSGWDKQDTMRPTDPSTKEHWTISSRISAITALTEPPHRIEQDSPRGEVVNVQKEEVLGTQAVTLLESPKETQQYSKSFRNYKRNEILRQVIDYLRKFQESLNTLEAPRHIHLAKKKLEESWEFITEEDEEVRLTLSALEGAIRQQKWRDYKPRQIATLQSILQECIDGRLHGLKDVLKITSKLRKQDIDIFPSAPEWAYEEDDETEA
jgi:hypothetical protein